MQSLPAALRLAIWLGLILMTACAAASGEPRAGPDEPVESSAVTAEPGAIAEGVAGLVTNAAGRPVAGALIAVTSMDAPGQPIPDIAILTDAAGRFVWPLRPGRYRVAAVLDGREIAVATASVERGSVATIRLTGSP
jgi:hypothetical protein